MAKTYIMVATDELESLDYSTITKNSLKNVRLNNDGTKCVISFPETQDQPVRFENQTEYTASEMRTIVNSSINEWYIPPSDMASNAWYIRVKDVVSRYNPFRTLSNWLYTETLEE